jgi:hypothetical protein
MDARAPHVRFVNRSGVFDWESNRLDAEYRAKLFLPSVWSINGREHPLCGCTPYMKCSTHSDYTYARSPFERSDGAAICVCLICRPDLHQDHIASNYTLLRPMPSSYHCLLDPSRRLNERPHLDELGDNVVVSVPGLTRFDRDPPLSFDLPRLTGGFNKEQPDYTWYHNNETEIGKIFPENYWNRQKLAGTAPSAYLVPTVL